MGSAAAALIASQQFIGLFLLGPLLGWAQWVALRRQRGVTFRWVLGTTGGWTAALLVLAALDRDTVSIIVALPVSFLAGIPIALAQRWALAPDARVSVRRAIVVGGVAAAGFFAFLPFLVRAVAPELPTGFASIGEPEHYAVGHHAALLVAVLVHASVVGVGLSVMATRLPVARARWPRWLAPIGELAFIAFAAHAAWSLLTVPDPVHAPTLGRLLVPAVMPRTDPHFWPRSHRPRGGGICCSSDRC